MPSDRPKFGERLDKLRSGTYRQGDDPLMQLMPGVERSITDYGPSGEWTGTSYSAKTLPPIITDTIRDMVRRGQPPEGMSRLLQWKGTDEQKIQDLMSMEPLMMLPRGLGNAMRMFGILPPIQREYPKQPTGKLEM